VKIADIRAKYPQYSDLTDRELVKGLHTAHYSDMPYASFLKSIDFSERVDPTEGMSGTQKFLAGSGKAVSDLWLGAKQITGNASQEEVDEVKRRDAALMDTGAGLAGNIAGNVAAALVPGFGLAGAGASLGRAGLAAAGKRLLASPATIGGAVTQGGLGAGQAALLPVATGEHRGKNAAFGLVGGALVPSAGMAYKGVKAGIEPLYQGGRNAIIGRAMNAAAGENAGNVAARLSNPSVLVPGSNPTAAEIANSGGIAAMQRAAAAVDPEAYAARFVDQNKARVESLRSVAGDAGERHFFEASRNTAANELYEKAFKNGVDIFRDPSTGKFLQKSVIAGRKGEITKLTHRPAVQEALKRARDLAANEGVKIDDPAGSVRGLHYVKTALDDMVEQAGKRGQNNEQRILTGLKSRLLTTIDSLSPDYAQARVTFNEMSKPINRLDVGEAILKGATSAQESVGGQPRIYGENLARALRDGDQVAARATGFGGAKIDDILGPDDLVKLKAVSDDVARHAQAQSLGRGAGSDTVQKLAMTNLMQRSGLPTGILDVPGVGRLGNWAYSNADDKMLADLARALLDPRQASLLMQGAVPGRSGELIRSGLLAIGGPLAKGTAAGLLNAP
jgi:hypothetical protein